jgi:hypothetical protein
MQYEISKPGKAGPFLALKITKRRLDSFYGPPNLREFLYLTALYFSITDYYLQAIPIEVYVKGDQ